jgi:hypothetical protein
VPSLAASEIRAVLQALTDTYVEGSNQAHWHLYTFTLSDGRSIRGRLVEQQKDGIVVGLDEPGNPHETIGWNEVDKLLIEAE